jgi:hypothetical protein
MVRIPYRVGMIYKYYLVQYLYTTYLMIVPQDTRTLQIICIQLPKTLYIICNIFVISKVVSIIYNNYNCMILIIDFNTNQYIVSIFKLRYGTQFE